MNLRFYNLCERNENDKKAAIILLTNQHTERLKGYLIYFFSTFWTIR
jgi:hypothetical protein